ncbi:hypothetical protein [Streptomyces sp. NPDC088730]|uniref:hypothetical protein n=1 Tax=Streptomyces sp. NPDC088730 TaxID=3365877 RepID=UPI003819BFAC
MIIDRNAGVTPNRYETSSLRRAIGKRLGRADRDDVLSSFIWVAEVRLAEELTANWRDFCDQLSREMNDANARKARLSWQFDDDQVADRCQTYASKVADKLSDEHFEAQQALQQCHDIAREIGGRLGLKADRRDAHQDDTQLSLGIFHAQLAAAQARVEKIMGRYRQKTHELAKLEEHQKRGAATPTLTKLDAMTSDQFDEVIRQAFGRSGFQTTDLGCRITEISRGTEKALVYSAHVQQPEHKEITNLRSMVRAQRAAEAAGFDAVWAITNLKFISHPAHRHIEETVPAVHLIQRPELQRWIQWEMPLWNGEIQ